MSAEDVLESLKGARAEGHGDTLSSPHGAYLGAVSTEEALDIASQDGRHSTPSARTASILRGSSLALCSMSISRGSGSSIIAVRNCQHLLLDDSGPWNLTAVHDFLYGFLLDPACPGDDTPQCATLADTKEVSGLLPARDDPPKHSCLPFPTPRGLVKPIADFEIFRWRPCQKIHKTVYQLSCYGHSQGKYEACVRLIFANDPLLAAVQVRSYQRLNCLEQMLSQYQRIKEC